LQKYKKNAFYIKSIAKCATVEKPVDTFSFYNKS